MPSTIPHVPSAPAAVNFASTRPAVAIAVAAGDGIGPEIADATLRILEAAGAAIAPRQVMLGKAAYELGHTAGISPLDLSTIREARVLLKGPVSTPQGGGFKSVNVTLRKALGMFANVRPVATYHPFVATKQPGMNVVIIRENEEDLYAGIEHRQTEQVTQCLKLITRPGCERIVRYTFEYALRNGRRKVSCFTKDNIMKMTDGLFHRVFDEIAKEYPAIQTDHWIIDIGAARLAARPEQFDVIVTGNLYGDIISDIAAEVAGSVGLSPSANIGRHVSMFEAIHGSAPDIAGRDIANPSGMLLAAVMMLVHLEQADVAELVHNAWLATIEEGVHTADVFTPDVSREVAGTKGFADAVIARLGRRPLHLAPVSSDNSAEPISLAEPVSAPKPAKKELVGIDIFLDEATLSTEQLAATLKSVFRGNLELTLITNRGVKVWPEGLPETFCTDHWRCRFKSTAGGSVSLIDATALVSRAAASGFDVIKTEHLYTFDGEPGYAMGQGQ